MNTPELIIISDTLPTQALHAAMSSAKRSRKAMMITRQMLYNLILTDPTICPGHEHEMATLIVDTLGFNTVDAFNERALLGALFFDDAPPPPPCLMKSSIPKIVAHVQRAWGTP